MDKIDDELFLLRKKVESLLNDNNKNFLNSDINYNKTFENNISKNLNKNNLINNNTFLNNYTCLNDINSININETIENIENKRNYLELNGNTKQLNNFNVISQEIKNINTSANKKRIKLKVIRKIRKINKYKGVSRNKKKWQVYIMMNQKNTYLGSYKSKKMTAKVYDLKAIKKNDMNAKTNFKYHKRQIKKIFKMNIDIKNILEIVSKNNIK